MKTDTGGPAYPKIEKGRINSRDQGYCQKLEFESADGMTLLDYFAGQAMAGELAWSGNNKEWRDKHSAELATRCYHFAEAMIAEKRRRENE